MYNIPETEINYFYGLDFLKINDQNIYRGERNMYTLCCSKQEDFDKFLGFLELREDPC